MESFRSISNDSLAIFSRGLCESRLETILNETAVKTVPTQLHNAAEFGTITGVAVAVLMNVLFSYKDHIDKIILQYIKASNSINAKNVSIIFLLTILLVFLPVLFTLTIIASFYKLICALVIKRKDRRFVGLLDSFDVFWSLEDDTSKSIINVLGIIESKSPENLISSIKDKLKTVFNENNKCMEKIFHRRTEEYGFYYWRRYSNIDLNEYVRIIEAADVKCKLDVNDLEELMAVHSETPLPYNNEGLFQILVTGRPVHVKDSSMNVKPAYGIIFKIHHSLSDGVALLDFLCQNLADNQPNSTVFKALCEQKPNSPRKLIDKIHTLIQMPICFVKGIIRKPDENALHGPILTGNKVFVWTNCEENLLQMMKEIKDKVVGVKCTDLLVTALAAGLRSYLVQRMRKLPEDVSVIVPIRFPKNSADEHLQLENNFSVTILDVPISPSSANIFTVKKRCDELRTSADPISNYYFLKLAGGVLPSQILKPMLASRQATAVLSNIPGPETLTICGGNALKQLVFFVPNKGTTGLGVTALSYGGELRLAAAADRALVSSPAELRVLLDGMVAEIGRLHRLHCPQ